jgi:6-pyruvoyltetrahydropterin/6-carboxytetrahydropterin synthase
LNDQAPFDVVNPSAENLAKYFYDETIRQMNAAPNGARITSITIWETDTTSATYRP